MGNELDIKMNVTFHHEKSMLIHYWDEDLSKNEAKYVLSLSKLATLVDTHRPRFILIVLKGEHKKYNIEFESWINKCILPVFHNAGVEKLALCSERDIQLAGSEELTRKMKFEVEHFLCFEKAHEWLISDN